MASSVTALQGSVGLASCQAATSSSFSLPSSLQPASEPAFVRKTTACCSQSLPSFGSPSSRPLLGSTRKDVRYLADVSSLHVDFGCGGLYWSARKRCVVAAPQRRQPGVSVCLMRGVGNGFWEGADSDGSSSNRFDSKRYQPPGKAGDRSVLLSLIQEIEPLDVGHISKDASPNSMDAMKRTISGMLGLLPSDQFHVTIETDRDSLARLLVSSMMTGYTLRNAEYRMCLQKTLELPDSEEAGGEAEGDADTWRQGSGGSSDAERPESRGDADGAQQPQATPSPPSGWAPGGGSKDTIAGPSVQIPDGLGDLSPEARAYIQRLQAQMAAVSQDLEECKRSLASAEMDVVGEDQNDLLDYLRNLDPEKVAELSQPTSPDVEEVIQQVLNNLLGRLGPLDGALAGGPAAFVPPPDRKSVV